MEGDFLRAGSISTKKKKICLKASFNTLHYRRPELYFYIDITFFIL
uniref:Uncharacterized protein n=1 Tax=Anguilla anguilla TaxID=7936 RepID=A0A0E9VMV4_ANGAN